MTLSIIAAIDQTGCIGITDPSNPQSGSIPWLHTEYGKVDLQWFKTFTIGRPLIMGANTYRTLSQPLVDRDVVVVSGTQSPPLPLQPNDHIVHNLLDALNLALQHSSDPMIAGGSNLYTQTIGMVQHIYLSIIPYRVGKPSNNHILHYFPQIPGNFTIIDRRVYKGVEFQHWFKPE